MNGQNWNWQTATFVAVLLLGLPVVLAGFVAGILWYLLRFGLGAASLVWEYLDGSHAKDDALDSLLQSLDDEWPDDDYDWPESLRDNGGL